MKKLMILMGVISLTACSSDSVFEEQSTDEELPMGTNSFNNQDSGQYAGSGPGGIGWWGKIIFLLGIFGLEELL